MMDDAQKAASGLKRRTFLRMGLLGGGAALLAACQAQSPAPAPTTAPPKAAAAPTAAPARPAPAPTAAPAKAAAKPFYEGKTINMVSFSSPGGSTERMLRLVMKHLPKHILGNPQMGAIEYMRGAGGVVQANHMYQKVEPDGLTLGQLSSIQEEWAVGDAKVKFDLLKFEFVADILPQNHTGLFLHSRLGLNTVEDVLASNRTLNLGTPDVGHTFYREPRLAQYLLGDRLKVNVVSGLDSDEIDLAIFRGELDGRVQSLPSVFAKMKERVDTGEIKLIWSSEEARWENTPNVPTLFEIAQKHAQPPLTDKDKALFEFIWTAGRYARYYGFPPKTPKERVETMREAFKKMVDDPEFKKEFEKQTRFVPTYTSGAEMLKRFQRLGDTPKDVKELFILLGTTNPLPKRG